MPDSSLVFWILGIPLVIGVVELARTVLAIRRMPASRTGRGAWSQSLRVRP